MAPPARGRTVCMGGATLDRAYRLHARLVPGSSNPATGRRGFGGVARNVAENLARLGFAVALVSRVGEDDTGRALIDALAALSVETRAVDRVPGASTAEYAAVLTSGGELALGLADMAVLDGLVPEVLARHADLIRGAEWVFADCNLPAGSLAWLADRAIGGTRYRLAVDAVSVAKSGRLPLRLDGIDLLFLNRDEAVALASALASASRDTAGGEDPGREAVPDEPSPMASLAEREGDGALLARRGAKPIDEVAQALRAAGAGSVVLTLGSDGALAASGDGTVAVPAVEARIVDVTGAGDSLIAATLAGLLSGLTLPEAVALGCRAAAHTLGWPEAVSPDLAIALR